MERNILYILAREKPAAEIDDILKAHHTFGNTPSCDIKRYPSKDGSVVLYKYDGYNWYTDSALAIELAKITRKYLEVDAVRDPEASLEYIRVYDTNEITERFQGNGEPVILQKYIHRMNNGHCGASLHLGITVDDTYGIFREAPESSGLSLEERVERLERLHSSELLPETTTT